MGSLRDKLGRFVKKAFKSIESTEDVASEELAPQIEDSTDEYVPAKREYPLVIWTPNHDSNPKDEVRLKVLAQKLRAIEQQIEEAERGIDQMDHGLAVTFDKDVSRLKALQEELSSLFTSRMERQRTESDDDEEGPDLEDADLTPEEDDKISKLEEEMARLENKSTNKEKAEEERLKRERAQREAKEGHVKKCKKLYGKISSRTHPDKVKEIELHELFKDASIAYANWDLKELENIWNYLNHKASRLLRSLMQRIDDMMEEIMQRTVQMAELRKSTGYQLWVDYNIPSARHQVEAYYKKRLDKEIEKTIQAIRSMDPTRYEPEPAYKPAPKEDRVVDTGGFFKVVKEANPTYHTPESANQFKGDTSSILNADSENELDDPWQ